MKQIILIMFISSSLFADAWRVDAEKAIAEAVSKQQPVMIDFYADWCGPCKQMAATTLVDPNVLESLDGFILIKVNIDDNKELAKKYKVSGIPHFVLLNKGGQVISETVGYKDSKEFNVWLKKNMKMALSLKIDIEAENVIFKEFEKSPLKAMEQFVEAYKLSPQVKQEMLMKKFVELNPQWLVPCLSDERLEVRLYATMVIKLKDEKFLFDPWAETAVRTEYLKAYYDKK